MSSTMKPTQFPSKVNFQTKVYRPLPHTVGLMDWEKVDAEAAAHEVLGQLSVALDGADPLAVASLFRAAGCHWRDTLALTAHLRTFNGHGAVTSTLGELHQKRGIHEISFKSAMVLGIEDKVVGPNPPATANGTTNPARKKWVNSEFTFRTKSPRAFCKGIILGLILGARLKALGVEFVIIEKNAKAGDNWARRYDCMRFHVYKSSCETPYLPYPEDTGSSLTRSELSAQMSRFAEEFDLNARVLYESRPESTSYHEDRKIWESQIACSGGERQVTAKFLVLAHGAGYAGRYIPDIPGVDLFRGSVLHSVDFQNAKELAVNGTRSVIVVGSANTAFDIMGDCYKAGLGTTMVQRSETYVVPMTCFRHPVGLGVYDHVAAETGDAIVHGSPLAVGGPLLARIHAMQSEAEPSGVTPVAYTSEGLELSDGTSLSADAIVWCTGFGSGDGRKGIAQALGRGSEAIANKMELIWGVDAEGETRGLYKRQEHQSNVWVLAGGTTAQRWYSKAITLQIKGLLEGILPDAYRETPTSAGTLAA
ncbi:hypothetical protein DL768_003477 [Monosporascus sp. mg162]|nr:hypothetical protein DL768_003477 [Monosporascus sp. mg162]